MIFLHVLYENQDRMEGLEDLLPGPSDRARLDDAEIAMYLGYTPLHQEVISRKLTKVQNLRLLGERDLLGFTPLHYAVNIPGLDDETVIRYMPKHTLCRNLLNSLTAADHGPVCCWIPVRMSTHKTPWVIPP